MRFGGQGIHQLFFERQSKNARFGTPGNEAVVIPAAVTEPLTRAGEGDTRYYQNVYLVRPHSGRVGGWFWYIHGTGAHIPSRFFYLAEFKLVPWQTERKYIPMLREVLQQG